MMDQGMDDTPNRSGGLFENQSVLVPYCTRTDLRYASDSVVCTTVPGVCTVPVRVFKA